MCALPDIFCNQKDRSMKMVQSMYHQSIYCLRMHQSPMESLHNNNNQWGISEVQQHRVGNMCQQGTVCNNYLYQPQLLRCPNSNLGDISIISCLLCC